MDFKKGGTNCLRGREVAGQYKDSEFRSGSQPDGRAPISCPFAHVDPGITVFVEARDVRLPHRGEEIPGEELTAMRMAGYLQIEFERLCCKNASGLMCEKNPNIGRRRSLD